MRSRFTVRYHRPLSHGGIALIVEDDQGDPYLFSGAALQSRLSGRLEGVLGADPRWTPLPAGAPYTLEELCRLIGTTSGSADQDTTPTPPRNKDQKRVPRMRLPITPRPTAASKLARLLWTLPGARSGCAATGSTFRPVSSLCSGAWSARPGRPSLARCSPRARGRLTPQVVPVRSRCVSSSSVRRSRLIPTSRAWSPRCVVSGTPLARHRHQPPSSRRWRWPRAQRCYRRAVQCGSRTIPHGQHGVMERKAQRGSGNELAPADQVQEWVGARRPHSMCVMSAQLCSVGTNLAMLTLG